MTTRETVQQTIKCNPNQYPQVLEEKFPHVLSKIISLWNSPDCGPYLSDLLQPNGRGGGRIDRDGFPERAWQEIFQINLLYIKPGSRLGR
jgi:hypothetical protein